MAALSSIVSVLNNSIKIAITTFMISFCQSKPAKESALSLGESGQS